jgi:hypothetical protein
METIAKQAPVRFEPSMEHPEEDEAGTISELVDTMHKIAETTHQHSGRGLRGVHAKSHGLLHGELRVHGGLPPELAQGLFAQPAAYPAIVRISAPPGDVLDDKVSTPRALSLKVLGAPGPQVDGADGHTQDFVMANGPAFNAKTAKGFAKNAKLLAATTDRAEGLKKALSAVLRGAEKAVEAVGGESGALKTLGGQAITHPLGETFYTQAPLLNGPYVAKLSLAPASPELLALKDAPVDLDGKPDGLRQAVRAHFAERGATWELRVQLCRDLEKMPIEDSSVPWPEDASPFVTVATLTVPAQDSWPEGRAEAIEDRLSFNPWHALAAHRPLGSIMRVRREVYRASVAYRAGQNHVAVTEPASVAELFSRT